MESFSVTASPDPEATKRIVVGGLREFNHSHLGPHAGETIAVNLLGQEGDVLGGAVGTLILSWLLLDALWVAEPVRSKGLGSRILNSIEEEALSKGAGRALLDTMGFQAEGFYEKHGYKECGRVKDFASGYDRVYMMKALGPSKA